MPDTQIFFYQDDRGVPVRDWLAELRRRDRRTYAKCVARIRLLAQLGFELRRPLADYVEEDIYELRIRSGRVNYRILYFFHGQNVAILTHALTKEDVIPRTDLARAQERKRAFIKDPEKHTYEEDTPHGQG